MDCDSLRKITIPEGVEEIGESAFQGCSKLEKVIMAVLIIHSIEIYLSLKQYTIGRN